MSLFINSGVPDQPDDDGVPQKSDLGDTDTGESTIEDTASSMMYDFNYFNNYFNKQVICY
jgi:hypothetical protein